MRFGFWPNPRSNYEDTKTLALHAEATGYDGIWLADHFLPEEPELIPVHESWITMAALSRDVPRVRIGTMVTGNTYRHPAILANMVATMDNLNEGRSVLGIGSGWQKNEHEAYGIEYGTVGSRLRMLDEACQIFQGLFNNDYFDFDGEFYRLNHAPLEPKPKQEKLPLMIGGGGEKRTLRTVARFADEWNVWGSPQDLTQKISVLEQRCSEVGRDVAEIQKSAVGLLIITESEDESAEIRKNLGSRGGLVGTPDQLRSIVAEYRAAGVDEIIVPDFTMTVEERNDLLDRFRREVIDA